MQTLVDFALSPKDGATLLKACPLLQESSKKRKHIILADHYVVSIAFIERCVAAPVSKNLVLLSGV